MSNTTTKKPLSEKERKILIKILFFCFIIIVPAAFFFAKANPVPDACACSTILDIPTEKVGIGMPMPIIPLPNKEFKKYSECYEEYAGPATALLKCIDSRK